MSADGPPAGGMLPVAEALPAGDPAALQAAVEALRAGGVVGVPTETVYGLAALPLVEPLERLVAIKRRSADKGIALLIDSPEQMHQFALVPGAAERLARAYWPGPMTLVLDIRPDVEVPVLLSGGRRTIGLRLPDHDVPRQLCRHLGPIAATSANISGQPDATTARQLLDTLGGELSLVLDDGPTRGGRASTVVSVASATGEPAILREGALSREQVMTAAAE